MQKVETLVPTQRELMVIQARSQEDLPVKPSREEAPTGSRSEQSLRGSQPCSFLLFLIRFFCNIVILVPLIREALVDNRSAVKIPDATNEV